MIRFIQKFVSISTSVLGWNVQYPTATQIGYDQTDDKLKYLDESNTVRTIATETPVLQTIAADGAISVASLGRMNVVEITKGTAASVTIANPAAADEGKVVIINSQTAAAHTVSNAAGAGFNGGGAATDVGTFGGAIGDGFVIVAVNQKWNVVVLRNVTLG